MKIKTASKALGAVLPLTVAACGREPERPNIVFFLVDDYGWTDSSVRYGDELYPYNQRFNTPNMQDLADKGVVMTDAYACPVSTPTRVCMMSGMNSAVAYKSVLTTKGIQRYQRFRFTGHTVIKNPNTTTGRREYPAMEVNKRRVLLAGSSCA